jgi:hypothetical protein
MAMKQSPGMQQFPLSRHQFVDSTPRQRAIALPGGWEEGRLSAAEQAARESFEFRNRLATCRFRWRVVAATCKR